MADRDVAAVAWRWLIEPLEGRVLLSAAGQFASRGPGGGGAFFSPSFSPHNSADVWAVTDMSGLFHSASGGASWRMADFRQVQGGRGTRVEFTADANVLYTIDYNEVNVPWPTRSADGGVTWTRSAGWNAIGNDVYALYADPASTTRVLATDYTTLYISNDGGATWNSRYTAAGGLYAGGAFFDGNTIYVGTSDGLLVSTNGGASFAKSAVGGIAAGQVILSLAGAKQNGTTRLAAVTASSADVYPGLLVEDLTGTFGGLYTIDIGAANWTNRSAGVPAGDQPHFVSMARDNIAMIYAAGSSNAGTPIVVKTTNGGANWSDALLTSGNQNVATGWQGQGGDRSWGFGEIAMGFAVSPTDPNTLAWTDFGFVHLSTDGGATWRQAYLSPADQNAAGVNTPVHKAYHGVGIEDTSALWMTWADANTVVAGYTDIYGVRSTDGGQSWAFPTNLSLVGNTLYQVSSLATASVPSGVILYGAGSSVHDLYQSTYLQDSRIDGGAGKIVYSTDKGATWATLHDFAHPVVYTAIDPTNSNRMYAAVVHSTQGGIFVTNNLSAGAASTWTKVANPPRTEGHPYNIKVLNDGTLVVTYSGRRTNGGAFTASSGVFVSANQGTSWTDRTLIGAANNPGMQFWTKDLTIDPTDATQNTWYAAVRSGFGANGNGMGGLYRTTNRGVNWTRIWSTDSAESAAINPTTGEMYLSTLASGLWYSANPSAASPVFSQVAAYPFRQPERVFFNPFDTVKVWVTSFGWGIAESVTADAAPPTVTGNAFVIGTGPQRVTVDFSEDVSLTLTCSDLVVKNISTNQTIDPALFKYAYDATLNRATLSATGFAGGVLADGNYRVTLAAGSITDYAGNALTTAMTFDFYVLGGDADRDRTVGLNDLLSLANHYGLSGQTWQGGDFDGDGQVGLNDLLILANHYGVTLTAAAPAEAVGAIAAAVEVILPVVMSAAVAPVAAPRVTPVGRASDHRAVVGAKAGASKKVNRGERNEVVVRWRPPVLPIFGGKRVRGVWE